MYPIEELAGKMYTAYCEAVGGKAFNGDPLPAWEEFRLDNNKLKQSDAWIAAAMVAFDELSFNEKLPERTCKDGESCESCS